jgi:hypothetical protein
MQKWLRFAPPSVVFEKGFAFGSVSPAPLLHSASCLLRLDCRRLADGALRHGAGRGCGRAVRLAEAETAAFVTGGTLVLYCGRYAISALRGGDGEREAAMRAGPVGTVFSLGAGLLLSGYGLFALPPGFAGCELGTRARRRPAVSATWFVSLLMPVSLRGNLSLSVRGISR